MPEFALECKSFEMGGNASKNEIKTVNDSTTAQAAKNKPAACIPLDLSSEAGNPVVEEKAKNPDAFAPSVEDIVVVKTTPAVSVVAGETQASSIPDPVAPATVESNVHISSEEATIKTSPEPSSRTSVSSVYVSMDEGDPQMLRHRQPTLATPLSRLKLCTWLLLLLRTQRKLPSQFPYSIPELQRQLLLSRMLRLLCQ
jgi:hypothetical protein